jgi:hypothetical protein
MSRHPTKINDRKDSQLSAFADFCNTICQKVTCGECHDSPIFLDIHGPIGQAVPPAYPARGGVGGNGVDRDRLATGRSGPGEI